MQLFASRSTDPQDLPFSAAYVRSLGINTIAVGVGEAEVTELRVHTSQTENIIILSHKIIRKKLYRPHAIFLYFLSDVNATNLLQTHQNIFGIRFKMYFSD